MDVHSPGVLLLWRPIRFQILIGSVQDRIAFGAKQIINQYCNRFIETGNDEVAPLRKICAVSVVLLLEFSTRPPKPKRRVSRYQNGFLFLQGRGSTEIMVGFICLVVVDGVIRSE